MKCIFGHKYTPIVAQKGHKAIDKHSLITIVTLRCQHCGKLKQQTLTGHLTLEDVLGGKR